MSQRENDRRARDVERFRGAFHSVVRSFGLLESGATPCGRPLPISVAHALMELLVRPRVRQGELAQALGLSKSAASRVVAQLEGRGWVERTTDETDGRVWRLALTVPGARVARQLNASSLERFALVLAGIPAHEREVVEGALRVLSGAIVSTLQVREQ